MTDPDFPSRGLRDRFSREKAVLSCKGEGDTSQRRWQERNVTSFFIGFLLGRFVRNTERIRHHVVKTCLTDIDISKQSRYDCRSGSPPIKPLRLPWIVAAEAIFICKSDFCVWKNNFDIEVFIKNCSFFLTLFNSPQKRRFLRQATFLPSVKFCMRWGILLIHIRNHRRFRNTVPF